jgi:hypothetical protein
MRFEQRKVTPEDARAWLDAAEATNRPQRHLSPHRVQRFRHDMETGRWELTHQPLAFDPDGILLDGQHRLAALTLAGVPVELTLAWDVDPGTFPLIDSGKGRSAADAIKILGFTDVNALASVCRQLLVYDAIKGTTAQYRTALGGITTTDVIGVLETERRNRLPAALAAARTLATSLTRYGLKTWGAVLHVLVQESALGEAGRAEFFARLTDGAMLPAGSPILNFRRWIANDTGLMMIPGRDRQAYFVANGIKTVNLWMAGETRQYSYWRQGSEIMPVIRQDTGPLP